MQCFLLPADIGHTKPGESFSFTSKRRAKPKSTRTEEPAIPCIKPIDPSQRNLPLTPFLTRHAQLRAQPAERYCLRRCIVIQRVQQYLDMPIEVRLVPVQVFGHFLQSFRVIRLVGIWNRVTWRGVECSQILKRGRCADEGLVSTAERAREVRGIGGEEGAAAYKLVADLRSISAASLS